MVEVPLTHGQVAIIDDEDAPRVRRHSWSYVCTKGQEYARCQIKRGVRQATLYMHRLLTDAPPGKMVDHRNGNGLDNRRKNLRLATNTQNQRNGRRPSHNTSGYKGVSLNGRRWRAHISVDGKRRYLGTFGSNEEAARAYDDAARKYYGDFAKVNFPIE